VLDARALARIEVGDRVSIDALAVGRTLPHEAAEVEELDDRRGRLGERRRRVLVAPPARSDDLETAAAKQRSRGEADHRRFPCKHDFESRTSGPLLGS
jgi:hypothetical protein